MKIRTKTGSILDVYFLVSVRYWNGSQWSYYQKFITKCPTIKGIRVHVPLFPDFEISAPNFTFESEQTHGRHKVRFKYSIEPVESCDLP